MITMNKILKKEECGYKAYLEECELNITKRNDWFINVNLHNLLKTENRNMLIDEISIEKMLKEGIEGSKLEIDSKIEYITELIKRYYKFESQNFEVINTNVSDTVNIEGEEIFISSDIVLKDGENIILCKYKNSKPTLTVRARNPENHPSNSNELFLLSELGEKLYPGKKIYGGLIHLKSKKDKNNKLAEYEEKNGDNLIFYKFRDIEKKDNIRKIKNIIQSKDISKKETSNCKFCIFKNICRYKSIERNLKEIKTNKKCDSVFIPTESQKEFINFEKGKVRVNAVAGAGKTTVIAKRVLNLIKKRYNPKNMLLITFSIKGCQEIKEKIDYWRKQDNIDFNIDDLNIYTFNSWGYEMINKHHKILGFKKHPKLIDVVDKNIILGEIISKYKKISSMDYINPYRKLFSAKGVVVEMSEYIDFIKDENIEFPEELVELKENISIEDAKIIMNIYNDYCIKLKKCNLLDYKDQINLSIELLIRKVIDKKYQHIMVDEFQDSDKLQLFIIKKLIQNDNFVSLSVLGDDSQAIYGFRGATQENILNFNKDFTNVSDITLKENYRSTVNIIELANGLNDLNKNKINKKMCAVKQGLNPVINELSYEEIVDIIKAKIKKGIKLSDIAIISRTKSELIEFQKILDKENIDNYINVGELLVDNLKVNNIIDYAQFLKNNESTVGFAEYVQLTKNKEFEKNKDNLKKFLDTEYVNFIENHMIDAIDDNEKLNVFYKTLSEEEKNDRSVRKLMEFIKSKNFFNINDLANYLYYFKIMESEIEVDKEEVHYDAITLTTAHSSKGQEYKVVIGLVDKFKYDNLNQDKTEEERRLLYVLVTRAKDEIVIASKKNNDVLEELIGLKDFIA